MNYNYIRQIVRILKKKISCPFCNQLFSNNDIHVISSSPNEISFYIHCHYCQMPIMASIGFHKKTIIEDATIEIQPIGKTISENEVLDMHNFLKNFNGDIAKYLKF